LAAARPALVRSESLSRAGAPVRKGDGHRVTTIFTGALDVQNRSTVGQRPLGSECCVVTGDGGCEA
jgi:hypothetical protein